MSNKPSVVLFADRDPLWGRALRGKLRGEGLKVYMATTLQATLDLSTLIPPDLIVFSDNIDKMPPHLLVDVLRKRVPDASLMLMFSNPLPPEAESSWQEMDLLSATVRPAEAESLFGTIRAALRKSPELATAGKPPGPLVLCVDDDSLYLDSLRRIIQRHGYRVAAYQDPERALESIRDVDPALAIVDVMMPRMNGLNLADEIRDEFGETLPVVLLSARGEDEDIVNGYRHGASYYITKPCDPRTVLNIVDYLVGDLDARERQALETQL